MKKEPIGNDFLHHVCLEVENLKIGRSLVAELKVVDKYKSKITIPYLLIVVRFC